MKNLYPKNKGKVYPSPSSPSTIFYGSSSPSRDALSVLNILPVAILALTSVLSLEDREVLAYMITRSMKTTCPSSMIEEKNKCKKSNSHNKPPIFECGCFDCYTIYWFRWDSSPNRELIHHAIEAFEDHLTNGEPFKKNGRGKKKDKMSHCGIIEKLPADKPGNERIMVLEKEIETQESGELLEPEPETEFESEKTDPQPGNHALADSVLDRAGAEDEAGEVKCMEMNNMVAGMEAQIQVTASDRNHKGLTRKVWDLLGLFNSRLWSLWSPSG
ncbi:hypothetical protein NE237_021549 [Protea cynaroides]|uniref:Uncharacterized protein n=1 Tax=Protea cynaroides TaxID=273540 RepID=A0A9Q0K2P8_9MAGN|nr:hypothetical protein NE237_021549 [Protea cynaroides]